MKSILRSFSTHLCSALAPSPSSQQPTTCRDKDSPGSGNTKTSSNNNNPKKAEEYRNFPRDFKDPKGPSLLFNFMVYASGGTLPSQVKKVTREAPKSHNSFSGWAFSGETTQYCWVVEKRRSKQRKRSKHHLDKEATTQGAGDAATHKEGAHEEDANKEDSHKEDAYEEGFCDKIMNERRKQKPIASAAPDISFRKPVPKATSRYSAPAPSSSNSEECWLPIPAPKEPR